MMNIFYKSRKISWRLTIIYTAIFIIVLMILNTALILGFKTFVKRNAYKDIDNTIKYVLPKITDYGFYYIDNDEADLLQDISKSVENIYFRVLDRDKDIIAQSYLLKEIDIPLKSGYQILDRGNKKLISRSIIIFRNGFLDGYFVVARDISRDYKFLRFLTTIIIIASIIGSIIALLTGFLVSKKSMQAINNITETANNISFGDLQKRLNVDGPEDEINRLARTFNSMLDRLENSFKRQQQFVSDASHELRTPISVIQGYIDLLDRWGKDEIEVRDEAIEAIKNEVNSMNSLLESLLFLARGESEKIDINKSKFDVNDLLKELIFESRMLTNSLTINGVYNNNILFYGDKKLIKQMLRIFLDNSIKFTPAGGEITLESEIDDSELILTVCDTGIGIADEDLPHIFKRFYRADKSRSRGGAGLGLAIAKWIIDNHQGRILIKSKGGEGTIIKVYLPLK